MKLSKPYRLVLAFGLLATAGSIYLFFKSRQKPYPFLCTRMPKVKIRGRAPAFTPNYRLAWANNTVLRVFFEEGKTPLTDSVLKIAQEWSKYCAITFVFAEKKVHSDIRVTFKTGGLASAIGKECIQPEYTNAYTTFLQGIANVKDKQEFRRIVLHEFGHTLGIEHELRNPNAHISWNKEEVYKFYKKNYGWNEAKVDKNVFQPLEPGDKPYGEFDKTSIMIYAIGPPMAAETIPWSLDLSASDKSGIATWYPKTNQ